MDITSLAGIAGLLGATKTGVDVVSGAYGLYKDVKAEEPDEEAVDEHLLRLSLLAVDRNLAILDGVNTRLSRDEQERLLGVASALELRPLAALLVNWPSLGEEPAGPEQLKEKEISAWAADLDQRDDHEQLLANARFIVSRVSALAAFAAIDPQARKALRLGLRLRNIHAAHRRLRQLLTSESALEHLMKTRKRTPRSAPPRTGGSSDPGR